MSKHCTARGPAALLGPVLREDGGGALGNLAHAGEEVEPGDGDFAQRRLGQAPRVEEQRQLAAVQHVVEGAPRRVAAVDVQHVREAVTATPCIRRRWILF